MANPQSHLIQWCPAPFFLRCHSGGGGDAMRFALCALPLNKMNLFFAILSAAYISTIFFFADSPAVSVVAVYNPFSLLHIPLYAILTLLIILSILPFKFPHFFRQMGAHDANNLNAVNAMNTGNAKNSKNPINPINPINPRNRLIIASFLGFIVAAADEYHQSFIPTREGSITDILLDSVGIALALWLALHWMKWRKYELKRWIEVAGFHPQPDRRPKR